MASYNSGDLGAANLGYFLACAASEVYKEKLTSLRAYKCLLAEIGKSCAFLWELDVLVRASLMDDEDVFVSHSQVLSLLTNLSIVNISSDGNLRLGLLSLQICDEEVAAETAQKFSAVRVDLSLGDI